jgi:hypothetical protein
MTSPLIGIMTSPKNNYNLAGNLHLFINIQKELEARGARSFVFSFQDVQDDNNLLGYIYSTRKQKWRRRMMPLPDLVYNRIPFRASEQTSQFQKCLQFFKDHRIPMFNPGFIDKYELYLHLTSNKKLKKYLPETILITSKIQLKSFHMKHRDIYLKPRKLSKGKNIYRLNAELILKSHNQTSSFTDFEEFWDEWGETFCEGFIAQPTIPPAILDGNRFDFRILSHWSATEKSYLVTGVGIRATEQNNLTTHTVNGGFILPYEMVQDSKHDGFITALVNKVGRVLSNQLGFLGEFSIDAGMDSEGNYVIYEVNSKPMSFDEEEIERKRIIHLCDIFTHIVNLKTSP